MLVGSARRRAIVTRNTEPASRMRAWERGANIEAQLRPRPRANATPARLSAAAAHSVPARDPKRAAAGRGPARAPSDSRLPGARHAGLADRVLDDEAGVARFRLRAQASSDGVEEAAHESHVRVVGVQLLFDAIYGFDQILLIAARKSHARHGILYGNQRLVYCGLLCPIHGIKFEPVLRKAASPHRPRRQTAGPKNKSPALGAGLSNLSQTSDGYLAGAFDWSVFDAADLADFLLCFL